MLTRPLQWAVSALSTLALLYLFFFIPLGSRTLFEHTRRVVATPEAQELGREVSSAGQQVLARTGQELEAQLRFDLRDAGSGDAHGPSGAVAHGRTAATSGAVPPRVTPRAP